MAFKDYSLTPASNTALADGTYVGPNMLRNKVRPAIQQLMADGKDMANELDTQIASASSSPASDISRMATRTLLAADTTAVSGASRLLIENGREGTFVFSTADLSAQVTADPNQGVYVAPASDTTGASGAWVRKYSGGKDARWFGAAVDGVTDDYIALQAWLDAGGDLYWPAGEYYSSQDLIARKLMSVNGVGFGFNALIAGYDNSPGTRCRFPAGVRGLIVYGQTTHDDTSDVVGNPGLYFTQEGSIHSSFKNFALIGANAGAAVTGFESRCRVHVDNVQVIQFKGKGFDIQGTADIDDASSDYGSVSLSTLRSCRAVECGSHGFNIRGRDSSVVLIDSCDAISNAGWGFLGNAFSGDTYVNCHAAANTLGSYKETSVIAASIYLGCYVEGGAGVNQDISYPCVVSGGNLAGTVANGATNAHTNGPQPTIISGTSNFNVLKFTYNWDAIGVIANECYMFRHATHGLWQQGQGATYDATLRNKNNLDVYNVPTGTQNIEFSGSVLSKVPTAGVGYMTGAGGAVTQISSRATGVTLNAICGAITLVSAAGSATWASFTVTNSAVAATDVIRVVQKSGADLYMIHVTAVGAGSFRISYATTGGTTTEQPVFNFAVVKAVAA